MAIAALAALLVTAAGCGGASQQAGGGSGGAVKKGGILDIGTTDYIDSLNPFVAINSQAYNSFVMTYPQLVQYGPGIKLEGDWATSWDTSKDGLTWTFHLKPGGKWSDGKPMTAEDAAWTGNTIVKFAAGPSAVLAPALTHVTSMDAPDANTLVIHYEKPVGNVLAQLEQFWVLPEHIWGPLAAGNGKALKAYHPEQHLPLVAGGPYTVTKYAVKGTTVYKPNPYFYGPKSNADAVTLTWYTNPTAMIAAFQQGTLDFVDAVPFTAVDALKASGKFNMTESVGAEVTNITFNSNPAKPKNRELLDPKVREALEYATNRAQIVNVIFQGYATPWQNLISKQSGDWVNPAIKPLPFDVDKANEILDSLGYKKGADGIRVVPATTGQYAQPAHKMEYDIMVPNGFDFNADRQFDIIAAGWKQAGVQVHLHPGGDAGQAYAYETAGAYTKFDLATWDWVGYVDPDFMLSVLTRPQWYSWSDTGYNDPSYDAQYKQQGTIVNQGQRRQLIWQMEQEIADARPYINLVEEQLITANVKSWTGFYPDLGAYCKCYWTSPHES